MTTSIPLIPCHYCGQIMQRHDVVFVEQVGPDMRNIYHASCWTEKKVKEAQNEMFDQYERGYP